jgi:hypothetical protein
VARAEPSGKFLGAWMAVPVEQTGRTGRTGQTEGRVSFEEDWCAAVPRERAGAGKDVAPSYASITLWDGDGLSTVKLERLILRPATWTHPAMRAAGAALALGIFVYLVWAVRASLQQPPQQHVDGGGDGNGGGGGSRGSSVGWERQGTVVLWAGALILYVAVLSVLRWVATFVQGRGRLRARLIAPVAKGPLGLGLLKGLVRHAKEVARDKGFVVAIANLDAESCLLPAFQSARKPRARTIFMQKRWGRGAEGVGGEGAGGSGYEGMVGGEGRKRKGGTGGAACTGTTSGRVGTGVGGGGEEETEPLFKPFAAEAFFDPRDLS